MVEIHEERGIRSTIDIGIPEQERVVTVHGLSQVLADSHSLHAMFMDQYTELALAVDEIAERIRVLGAPAPGTYRQFSELASVSEATDVPDAMEIVRRLVGAHEAVARTIRSVLPNAESAPDQVSTDLRVRRLERGRPIRRLG